MCGHCAADAFDTCANLLDVVDTVEERGKLRVAGYALGAELLGAESTG